MPSRKRRKWIANRGRTDYNSKPTNGCRPPLPVGRSPPGAGACAVKLLLAASEVVGFAKTGGLADVAGSLPRTLARRGHDCAVLMPLYRGARLGRVPVTPTEHR